MNWKTALISVTFIVCSFASAKERVVELCPRFILRGQDKVNLGEPERLLVCGDPKNPSWNNIPDNQATFHLKTFLQARGYNNPKFTAGKPGQIVVDIGEPTRVAVFRTEGDDPHFDITRLRHIVGEVITPSLLDETKTRVRMRMQAIGYACPEIEMAAATETGELVARVKSGPFQNLISIEREKIEGIKSEMFSRYDGFVLDTPYNNDYLAVTVHRILDQGVVQSAYFTTACSEKGAAVVEHFVAGPPRFVSFGFGLNTEQFAQVRASWKHSRLSDTSSIFEVSAIASLKKQTLDASYDWYIFPEPSRFYLRPSVGLKHENVELYESLTAQFKFAPAWTIDTEKIGYKFNIGPTLNLTKTLHGVGPIFAKFLSVSGEAHITDHYYEFYRGSPRQGFDYRLEGNFTENNLLSNVTANLMRVGFEQLWNVSSFDPPAVVIGLRGSLGTTVTNQNTSSGLLPTDFRHFLGGSTDFRGSGLRELPDDQGSLTALYLGLESRFTDLLPWGLQPLLFLDGAVFSKKSFSIDGPVVYAPGAGLRFESKIGVIRATFSRGIFARQAGVDAKRAHPQFYFSFGEEF